MLGASEPASLPARRAEQRGDPVDRRPAGLASIVTDAVDGKLSLGDQRAVDDFDVPDLARAAADRRGAALYGDNLGENIRDTNLTPDFPRAASLIERPAEALVRHRHRRHRLGGPGGARLGAARHRSGRWSGTRRSPPATSCASCSTRSTSAIDTREEQDAYFDRARGAIFDTLVTRDVEPLKVAAPARPRPAKQRRFLVWSARPGGATQLAGHGSQRRAARATPATSRTSGLYLNDGTAAKIEYYLDYDGLASARPRCTDEGAQTLQVGMVLELVGPASRRLRASRSTSPATAATPPRAIMRHQPAHLRAAPAARSPALTANGRARSGSEVSRARRSSGGHRDDAAPSAPGSRSRLAAR